VVCKVFGVEQKKLFARKVPLGANAKLVWEREKTEMGGFQEGLLIIFEKMGSPALKERSPSVRKIHLREKKNQTKGKGSEREKKGREVTGG